MHTRPSRADPQSGFTLIEVLVAILVLCFGMLGVVGLQAAALQANKEARYQSSAVRLSRELGDMMRGNRVTAISSTSTTNPYLGDFTETSAPTVAPENCFAIRCSSAKNVASYQVADWFKRLSDELPEARAVICFDATPYDSGTGQGKWDCSNTGDVVVLKLGWTHQSLNRSADGGANGSTVEKGATVRPSFVIPILAS